MKSQDDFFEIEDADGTTDVFTDMMGITTFSSSPDTYVNITFLKGTVVPLCNSEGKPASSNVVPKRVASVTMSIDKARKLHTLLGDNLSKYDKKKTATDTKKNKEK
ncbi:hypothetical protein [Providencia rettgeri]|uniref:hypothetical protein n=1 Tax=Providencia rettgeri TaxID=587 RepID=UPI000CFE63A8|nr:hypothetical protein [Providencia rettgeri]AVL75758.1 hypothetical protein CEQ08_19425 [Providencia rettgeri]